MKVYLTKYALSTGIRIEEGGKLESGYWSIKGDYSIYSDNECHGSKAKALARAEEMRIKKLQSLDKQIKKLSAMVFEL